MKRFASLGYVVLLATACVCISGCDDDDRSPPADAGTVDSSVPDSGARDAGDAAMPAEGIAAVLAAPDGPADIAVVDVLVTYVRPAIGVDMPGFFVQAAAVGPALVVQVDPSEVNPGDLVSFRVTEVETRIGHKRASAIDGLSVISSDNDTSALVQDASATDDLVENLSEHAHELIAVDVTITGALEAGGEAFTRAVVATESVSDRRLQLRLPTTLWDSYPLTTGCTLHVEGTPLWAFMEYGQVSAWEAGELSEVSCP